MKKYEFYLTLTWALAAFAAALFLKEVYNGLFIFAIVSFIISLFLTIKNYRNE